MVSLQFRWLEFPDFEKEFRPYCYGKAKFHYDAASLGQPEAS